MGVGRLTPHRVRAKYARALAEIPLPVRSFDRIDPSALQILAETDIRDLRLRSGVLAATPAEPEGSKPPVSPLGLRPNENAKGRNP